MKTEKKNRNLYWNRDLCWNRDTVTHEIGSSSASLRRVAQLSLDGTVTNKYCRTN